MDEKEVIENLNLILSICDDHLPSDRYKVYFLRRPEKELSSLKDERFKDSVGTFLSIKPEYLKEPDGKLGEIIFYYENIDRLKYETKPLHTKSSTLTFEQKVNNVVTHECRHAQQHFYLYNKMGIEMFNTIVDLDHADYDTSILERDAYKYGNYFTCNTKRLRVNDRSLDRMFNALMKKYKTTIG